MEKVVIEINGELLFMQMVAVVSVCGFAGELYRNASSLENITALQFFANLLASVVISMLLAYTFYRYVRDEQLTLLMSGMLSFSKVEDLKKIKKRVINTFISEVKNE